MLNPNTLLRHGRYRIIRLIGQGGMGAVYEAEDLSLKTKVAVKEAQVYEASLRRAFEKEAQRLARLRHPALPNVIDHFTEQGGQYLVMEFIEGQDLADALKQRGQPFPVPQVISWAERLLDALDYLHQEGVIHRDIKPANIKLTPKGQIILLDFGLAKGGLTRHTLSGMSLKGYTPGYAPPEQVKGLATDERSDLYSLAATLYTLLTNEAPEEPSVRQRVMAHHVPDPLRPVNELNPHVSPQLAHILARALALEPSQRFATAAEMRSQLVSSRTQAVTPAPIFERTTRRTGDRATGKASPNRRLLAQLPTWAIAAGSVIFLLVGIFLGSMLIGNPGSISEATPIVNANTPAAIASDEESTTTVPAGAPTSTRRPTYTPIPPSTNTPVPLPPEPPLPTDTPVPTEPPLPTQTPLPTDTPVPPTPEPGQPTISEKDQMTLLYVSEGEFEMGSADDDPDAASDEKPRHTVFLDAYWIDQTEVTNAMFATFVEETGHETEAEKEGSGYVCADGSCGYLDGANWQHPQGPESDLTDLETHPVVQVSWDDATAYCQWAGRRLPTEAEWEKAAGGTDSRKWPWGNESPNESFANVSGYVGGTTPVGSYEAGASPYGALDMAGNVWEWVNDSWDSSYYEDSPNENPLGPKSYGIKVLRGGSWNVTARYSRARLRNAYLAYVRAVSWGFRCAR